MSNGVVKYALPAQGQDQFQGFRDELSNIDKRQKEAQQKSLGMASMIETADSTTMFGGDYSVAQKWAGQLTDNLDYYASSTERMIEFQQMTQQLTNFIDASEAYKTENFGKASEGAKPGSFMGATQRISGIDPYEDEGYRDEKTKEEYEMAYMGLSQGKDLIFNEQGQPMLVEGGNRTPLDQYQRPQNPFMPRLTELDFEGGFEWMESNAKGHAFPDGRKDARAWVEEKAMDPKLRRKIVKDWAKKSGNTRPLEDLLKDPTIVDPALEEFYRGAMSSFETHYGEPKPEEIDESKTLGGRFNALVSGMFAPPDMNMVGAEGSEGTPPLGPGLSPSMESPLPAISTGFEALYELDKPINSRSAGDGRNIVGFNVDAFGNLYVALEGPGEVVVSGDSAQIASSEDPGMEVNVIKVEPGSPLARTMEIQGLDREMMAFLMSVAQQNVELIKDNKKPQTVMQRIAGLAGDMFGGLNVGQGSR